MDLEKKNFDAAKLARVENPQEDIARDPAKAREMEYVRLAYGQVADAYAEYQKDPGKVKREEVKDTNIGWLLKSWWPLWQEKGISPGYIRQLGETIAESAGALEDYRQEIGQKTPEVLEKDLQSLRSETASLQTSEYEPWEIFDRPKLSGDIRNMDLTLSAFGDPEHQDVISGMLDIGWRDSAIVNEMERVRMLLGKIKILEDELKRRKGPEVR
jgi:hypothetical protein